MAKSIVVYGLITFYVASERFLRQGQAATSPEAQATDQGSTRAIVVAFAASSFALELAPLLTRRRIAALPGCRLLFPLGVLATEGTKTMRAGVEGLRAARPRAGAVPRVGRGDDAG